MAQVGEIEPEIEPEPEGGLPGEGEAAPEPEGEEAGEADPSGTAVRINFVVGGHQAKRGLYVVQTPGGGEVAWPDQELVTEVDENL